MVASKIVFDVDTKPIDKVLKQLREFGENPYDFLDEAGGQLATTTQQRFDAGVGPDGQAWTPSQRALEEGGKTLKKDGFLSDSITHDATSDYVDVGTDKVYAAIHQFGGTAGRNKSVEIEARPYLGFSADDQMMIEALAYQFIGDAARV